MQCPKRGLVASGGNVLPYRDYLVSGQWVMNLLQQRERAFACARAELIKVGKNLPRLLQNLDTWEHEEEQAALTVPYWCCVIEIKLVEKAISQSPRCRRMAGSIQT